MDIYFVRHGHPNYKEDCLTELGHQQAAAAAERLKGCGIQQIYASTCGRAFETAEHTARALGLAVQKCEFMREISWKSPDGEALPHNGNPWDVVPDIVASGEPIPTDDWTERDPFCKSRLPSSYSVVAEGIDRWLADLGYTREGAYYRVGENTNQTVAMFSHGGSSSVALSHLLNVPFLQICAMFHLDFTSVTVLHFPNKAGELVMPKLYCVGDAKHIEGLGNITSTYGM